MQLGGRNSGAHGARAELIPVGQGQAGLRSGIGRRGLPEPLTLQPAGSRKHHVDEGAAVQQFERPPGLAAGRQDAHGARRQSGGEPGRIFTARQVVGIDPDHGIESFGQSGDISDLYRTYRIDTAAIIDAVARAIA